MIQSLHLLKALPLILKISWVVLLLGESGLLLGYLTSTKFLSFTGLELLALGLVIALFDMFGRKTEQELTAGFHTGIVLAPILSFGFFVLLLFLVAIIVLLDWFLGEGYSGHGALHLLHLCGILACGFMVAGIAVFALRIQKDKQSEQAEGKQT